MSRSSQPTHNITQTLDPRLCYGVSWVLLAAAIGSDTDAWPPNLEVQGNDDPDGRNKEAARPPR